MSNLTVASWTAYRFLERQVRWSGISISFRISSVYCDPHSESQHHQLLKPDKGISRKGNHQLIFPMHVCMYVCTYICMHVCLCVCVHVYMCACMYVYMCKFSSVVAQSCPSLCDPVDCSTPAFPVHHQLLELTQTHVHPVGDDIQPSHPLVVHFSSCLQSFPALNKSNSPKYKSCIFQKCKFVLAFKKIKAIRHTNRI